VADVKKSDPNNQLLRSCAVPPTVGGSVDVLVGVMYLSSFPEMVHMLDCGLSIFKVKLSPYDKRWNALIGGPHETFNFLSEKSGNTSQLLVNFVNGLKQFRTSGPPSLTSLPWTVEEELFAKSQNMMDTEVDDVKKVVQMEFAEYAIANFVSDAKFTSPGGKNEFTSPAGKNETKGKIYVSRCVNCLSVDIEEPSVKDPAVIGCVNDLGKAMLADETAWNPKGLMRQVESSGLDVRGTRIAAM
jgi:hypothetical protein